MPALEKVLLVQLVPYPVQLACKLMIAVGHLLSVVPRRQRGRLQRFKHKHRMVGAQRTAALGDDVGLFQLVLHAHVHQRAHCVVGILLYGIIH